MPALQLVHTLEPTVDHEPATHDEQTVEEMAPTRAEKVPVLQPAQVVAATTDDHVPGEQRLQEDAPDPEKVPVLHGVQEALEEVPSVDHVPAAQLRQEALTTSRYVPLGQRGRKP